MKIELPPKPVQDELLKNDYLARKFFDFLKKTDEHYFYWDEFKYQNNLPYDDGLKAWALTKIHRKANYKTLKFGKSKFNYFLTESIQEKLHNFDLTLIGGLYKNPITTNQKTEYLKNSVLNEAIASSQVEGASTTTKVAYRMLKSGRKPRNESEQMIFNNLKSIKLISNQISEPLDFALIVDLHKTMTANTSAAYCAGDFRKKAIFVQDHVDGEIAHTAPQAETVKSYMADLCAFANSGKPFVHPIVKASILHFMIGYIHPFLDGNGRTARALFYWFLMKKSYSLIENVSISQTILDSRRQYDKSFLKTEYDDSDLTYFINYSLKNLTQAFERLVAYRNKKKELGEKAKLVAYKILEKGMNKRQADLIGKFYVKKNASVNLTEYAENYDVVRQTARKDLNELRNAGLVLEKKEGRQVLFSPVSPEKIAYYLD